MHNNFIFSDKTKEKKVSTEKNQNTPIESETTDFNDSEEFYCYY